MIYLCVHIYENLLMFKQVLICFCFYEEQFKITNFQGYLKNENK